MATTDPWSGALDGAGVDPPITRTALKIIADVSSADSRTLKDIFGLYHQTVQEKHEAEKEIDEAAAAVETAEMNKQVYVGPEAHHRLGRPWMFLIAGVVTIMGFSFVLMAMLGLGLSTWEALATSAALIALELILITVIGITMQNSIKKFSKPAIVLMIIGSTVAIGSFYPRWNFLSEGFYVSDPILATTFLTSIAVALLAFGVFVIAYTDVTGSTIEGKLKKAGKDLEAAKAKDKAVATRLRAQRGPLISAVTATAISAQREMAKAEEPLIPFPVLRKLVAEMMGLDGLFDDEEGAKD